MGRLTGMSSSTAKMGHQPLSQYTAEQLHARSGELRAMAKTARLSADVHALEALAERFEILAERRSGESVSSDWNR
jgi:hypothetical protein